MSTTILGSTEADQPRGPEANAAQMHARRAVAEDRDRIARDLCDTVIRHIFAAGLDLHVTMGTLDNPDRTRVRLTSTIDSLDQAITELRTAIFSLETRRPSSGGLRGLAPGGTERSR